MGCPVPAAAADAAQGLARVYARPVSDAKVTAGAFESSVGNRNLVVKVKDTTRQKCFASCFCICHMKLKL
jgi:hypothetical protein